MSDKLEIKEKKKLFIYMTIILVVVSFVMFILMFYNKVIVMEYRDDDISFKYYSDFTVRKTSKKLFINSKDELASIEITFNNSDTNYYTSDYAYVSDMVVNDIVDSSKYVMVNDGCIDHMCTKIYDGNDDKLEIVVEFRDNLLVIYKFIAPLDDFDLYSRGFDIVVNSFVKQVDVG